MCRFAVDLRAEAVAHGQPGFDFSDGLARLRPLADEGLVTLQGSKVTVTGDGRRAVRLIDSCFAAYLGAASATGGRHSRAACSFPTETTSLERQSVVLGNSEAVRVGFGSRRII